MNTFAIILAVVDVIICITMIALVIMQEGNSQGLGSIAGAADTFFGKNKGRSIDVVFKKVTTGLAVVFALVTIVLFSIISRA